MAFIQEYKKFLETVDHAIDLGAKTADKKSDVNVSSSELRGMIKESAQSLLNETEVDEEFINLQGQVKRLIESADHGNLSELIKDIADIAGDVVKIVIRFKNDDIDIGELVMKASGIATKTSALFEEYGADFLEVFSDYLKDMHSSVIELQEKIKDNVEAADNIDSNLKSVLYVAKNSAIDSVDFLEQGFKATANLFKGLSNLGDDDQIICNVNLDENGNVAELKPCEASANELNDLAHEHA